MSFYTYAHFKADTGEIFYIGKGTGRRYLQGWTKSGHRSEWWKRVVDKHGYRAEILAEWPTEQEAFEHERFLISSLKDIGAPLTNLSDGGLGASGAKRSPEVCEKIGSRYRGKKLSESHCKNIGLSKSGVKQSQATIEKRVAHIRGKKRSPEVVAKIVLANKAAYQRDIICIENGMEFPYLQDAVDWLKSVGADKARKSNICSVAKGYVKRAYGYTWKYKDKAAIKVNQGSGI